MMVYIMIPGGLRTWSWRQYPTGSYKIQGYIFLISTVSPIPPPCQHIIIIDFKTKKDAILYAINPLLLFTM